MNSLKRFILGVFDPAWNAHDLEGGLRLFADDAVVQTTPPMPGGPDAYRGKDEIRAFMTGLLPGFHVDSRNVEAEGNRATWYAVVSCDAFRRLGLDALDCFTEAVVEDGRVTAFRSAFTAGSAARMQAALNAAKLRRLYEVFSTGDVDAADGLIAADAIDHEAFPGIVPAGGLEGFKQIVRTFRAAFPDLEVTADDVVAAGDRVAARFTMRGTHCDTFLGIPATGNRIELKGIDVVRCAGGTCVEHWAVSDTAGLLQQLGVLPGPEAAAPPSGDGAAGEAVPDVAATVRAIYDAFNARNFDYTAGLCTEASTITNVPAGLSFRGPEGMRAFLEGWTGAFPDAVVEVTNVVAAGERVVVEFTARGTHTGPLMGPAGPIPPTGRRVEIPFCDVWQLRDGRIAEARTYFDLTTMLRQLGLIPTPEAAA